MTRPLTVEDIIPPGVTRRSIATLISRRQNPFSISGTAIVCCRHGVTKREVVEAEFPAGIHPHVCPCCENLYGDRTDIPGLCPICETRSAA